MKRILASALCLAATAGAATAQVHAIDVILSVQNGKIMTGRVINGVTVTPLYVNVGNFGDIGVPNATFNPGFDSENGTFPPGLEVGITIRRALRIWNGQDGFSLIPGSPNPVTTLQLTKNASTISTPNTDPDNCGVGDDLILGLANSLGRLHQHPAYQLVGQGDNGVYMLEIQIWMGDHSTGVSDPVYILLNQNDDADIATVLAWSDANLHAQEVPACYANCDRSTVPPILNANDFQCFLNQFAAGSCFANCDGSTAAPVLNANDFQCFLNQFAAGCS